MILTGRDSYSARLNAMFNDPSRNDDEFWKLLRKYIERVCNALTDNASIDALTQDVLIQVWECLTKFTPDPAHNGSGFSRWVTGICKRRANEMRKCRAVDRMIPVSQIPSDSDDGESVDLTSLADSIPEGAYLDALDVEDRQFRIADALDKLRAALPEKQRVAFDLIRAGMNQSAAAREVGLPDTTVNEWFRNAWPALARESGIAPEVLNAA